MKTVVLPNEELVDRNKKNLEPKRLLYITDMAEGTHESAVDYLFGKYLKRYLKVERLYFSKNITENYTNVDDDIIISYRLRQKIHKFINFSDYDVIIIRNRFDILNSVLKQNKNSTKIGFQLTFPHSYRRKFQAKMENRGYLRKSLEYVFKHYREHKLLEKCDFFFPISWEMKKIFFPNLSTPTLPLPMGIECESASRKKNENQKISNFIKRFVYIGTVDPLRRMDLVFQALVPLIDQEWELDIYTKDTLYTHSILPESLKSKITVFNYIERSMLMETLGKYDCGIFLLPENTLYNVASPTKVMDYYQAGIPALMSPIPECLYLFDNESGFFSPFETSKITENFQLILSTHSHKLKKMGEKGRKSLRKSRSYCKLAEKLYLFLREQISTSDE